MPLSEHEQRLLEQMEQALYAEDPKFATSMRHSRGSASDRRRVAVGVVGLLLGLGLLVAGVAAKLVVIGVIGFVAMVGGLWLAINSLRPSTETAAPATEGAPAPADQHLRSVAQAITVQAAPKWVTVRAHGGAVAPSPRDWRLLSGGF